MKICVYAICKNESKFVSTWLNSMQEADYIVVMDTGSTDGTFKMLKEDPRVTKVTKKIIKPWRFDVARNESMKLIPEDADVCVCTDLDEVFEPGWAQVIRDNWTDDADRMTYVYAWSHNAVGEPADIFMYDKIHRREGYHWIFPVHEVLMPDHGSMTSQKIIEVGDKIFLHHYPDTLKPRGYYLDLLKLSVEENPYNPHVQMLYAREFLHLKDYDKAIEEYHRCLTMPHIDDPEYRAVLLASLLHTAILYLEKKEYNTAIWYCEEFIKTDRTYREPYLLLAEIYNILEMPTLAYGVLEALEKYCYRHYTWVEMDKTYTNWLETVRCVTREHLNELEGALNDVNAALAHDPDDITLLKNKIIILERIYNRETSKATS